MKSKINAILKDPQSLTMFSEFALMFSPLVLVLPVSAVNRPGTMVQIPSKLSLITLSGLISAVVELVAFDIP